MLLGLSAMAIDLCRGWLTLCLSNNSVQSSACKFQSERSHTGDQNVSFLFHQSSCSAGDIQNVTSFAGCGSGAPAAKVDHIISDTSESESDDEFSDCNALSLELVHRLTPQQWEYASIIGKLPPPPRHHL